MKDQKTIDDIISRAFKRMHRYTCAEASLQALLELWDLPVEDYAWATGGYMGAITTTNTTCGVLIGTGIAIGLQIGREKKGIPENHVKERSKSIRLVNKLYRGFTKQFKTTECKELTNGFQNKDWGKKCDECLNYVVKTMLEWTEKEKI